MKNCTGIECFIMITTGSQSKNGYGLGVSIGLLIAVIIILILLTLSLYYCAHMLNSSFRSRNNNNSSSEISIQAIGLDEATLQSFPKLPYSEVKASGNEGGQEEDQAKNSCSICLGDYKDDDMLRVLPECDHHFHMYCVDSWLREKSTCPICRCRVVPPPKVAAVTEVAPPPPDSISRAQFSYV